ncbi:MAG: phage tail protein [Methylococcaceae bacterium]|nr:phage tail protein [Methylococcaceae bacterium]MDD1615178.1 phage tail protein [Methylococcaceae bacterium]
MALTKDEIKAAYPLPVYNYKVEIAGTAVAFSEVSGLGISYDVSTYKESPTESGAPGPRVMRMPAQQTDVKITLKKGVVRGSSVGAFFKWINATQINQTDKKDIYVRLCDEKGDAVISWKVINAFPTKLTAPTFDAKSNDAAIESMELVGDGVAIEES